MTILEILSSSLVGKRITMEKYIYRTGENHEPSVSLFIPNSTALNRVRDSRPYTYEGSVEVDIIAVSADSDKYTGESMYMKVSYENTFIELSLSLYDVIEIV
jgi:hypothetical protein